MQIDNSYTACVLIPHWPGFFSGSHLYSTTPMPNWRVKQRSELVYGYISLLFRLNMLVRCGRKKGVHSREVSNSTQEFYMTDRPYLRTHDLALAGRISVQQVRNYEASGLIPKAQRSPSGYRLYTQHHLAALKTARSLARGYGWQRTSKIMQALHRSNLSAALATIDERHAELASKRLQVEQTLSALHTLAA